VVPVRVPLLPLPLIWLLPNEMRDPDWASTPVLLPPIVDTHRPGGDAGTTEKETINVICHQFNPVQRHRSNLTTHG